MIEEALAAETILQATEASQAKARRAMTGALQEARQATTEAAVHPQAGQATIPAAVQATAEEARAEDSAEAVDIAEAVQAEAEVLPAEEDKGRI